MKKGDAMKKFLVLILMLGSVAMYGQSNWYNTLNEIRGLKTHATGDDVGCLVDSTMYEYSATDTNDDDGTNYLKPYNVAFGDNGRWVKQWSVPRNEFIKVTSDTVAFGVDLDSNTLVFVIDTSMWFRLTHLVDDTMTMRTAYDSSWFVNINTGLLGGKLPAYYVDTTAFQDSIRGRVDTLTNQNIYGVKTYFDTLGVRIRAADSTVWRLQVSPSGVLKAVIVP